MFLFMFTFMKELMFYDNCVKPNVILDNLMVGLDPAILELVNLHVMLEEETKSECKMSQVIYSSQINCILRLYTWNAAEAI